MHTVTVVFPHQLFSNPQSMAGGDDVVLVEDPLFFTQFPFHQQKLVLHRASMQAYAEELKKRGKTVQYIEVREYSSSGKLLTNLASQGVRKLHLTDPDDDWLTKRIDRATKTSGIDVEWFLNPNFITPLPDLKGMLGDKEAPPYSEEGNSGRPTWFMHNFYQKQRKRMNILMENGKPQGGKWSFDAENRKKLPKGLAVPQPEFPRKNPFVEEAQAYVKQNFSKHPGSADGFRWPVTREEAWAMWENFLSQRMQVFGPYEDAISTREKYLFHSLLTPALNIGLLNPGEIVDSLMAAHPKRNYPLASLEGFIRQIIGWREFMRGIYRVTGVRERNSNFFGFSRKIPTSFWEGTTGIPPVDLAIHRALESGYNHHIERLMVLGNFMLLCEFEPNEVYEWFMSLFIDAYDWVMVPNVYGMSQFADGGLITTKPYLSGSNYIRKMSDFKKGPWCEIWDSLYWRFIGVHGHRFAKNIRMRMVLNLWERMDPVKKEKHLQVASDWLKTLS